MTWWVYALGSALAASLTAILAKIGIRGVPSNLATAIRTLVVLVFAWGIAVALGEHRSWRELERRAVVFLLLSGLGTGLSWLCYFKALSLAPASSVAPLDKLSLAFTIVLAAVVLGETITWRLGLGTALMVIGALITLGPLR
jgi:bacterial/archaeal transporter family protein